MVRYVQIESTTQISKYGYKIPPWMAPFSFEDSEDDISALDYSTYPREDGLMREFFLEHWDILHIHLLPSYEGNFLLGVMRDILCFGRISFIPKRGDTTLLCQ